MSAANAGGLGRYGIYAPSVVAASHAQAPAPAGTVMVTPANATAATILDRLNRPIGDTLGLEPAGRGGVGYEDRPINYALLDAKAAAIAAMTADSAANRPCTSRT